MPGRMDEGGAGAASVRALRTGTRKISQKMRMIRVIALRVTACAFQGAANQLWAGSIYTWTDQNRVVHITETPPPEGVAVDEVMGNPPESASRVRSGLPQPQPVGSWEIQQAEQQARQAAQQLQQAEKNAQQARQEAERTIRESQEYIDSHDNNQYMRTAHKYQLRQARNAILASEAKVQEAADQLKQAEQNDEAARQLLQEVRDGFKII